MLKQKIFNFSFILNGENTITSKLENDVYNSGCDDAILHSKNGTVYLEFDRKDTSLKKALISAIQDIEKIHNIEVSAIEPADYVTIAEIARRSQLSREYIRQLINGIKGKNDFPKPKAGALSKTLIYSWFEVSTWLTNNGSLKDKDAHRFAFIIKRFNDYLDVREHPWDAQFPVHLLQDLNNIQKVPV
jgi:hypothetical protein|tara:strand:- start:133 stop:696 length:564 start_codon:yes stop_codon:yes gene_type:complete